MTISVASIITRANDLLQDVGSVRWAQDELVRWLNDGQREVVRNIPGAGAVNASVLLVSGTKQSVPETAERLLDIPRNMGATGTTPGRAIRLVEREVMDAQMPDWHTSEASATVKHFMFDERDSRHFYTWPPVPSSPAVHVEMIYSAAPTDCALNGNISLDDTYGNVLLDYILYRAFSKDSEAASAQRAAGYYQLVASALGIKHKTDLLSSPNVSDMSGVPPRGAG